MPGETASDRLRELLTRTRTIAVVGASPEPWRASFGISRYLREQGYRMIPVNPNHRGETLHGERVLGSVIEIGEPVDLVNVFRRPDALGAVVDDAIATGARALWTQLGVWNPDAAARAEAAGLTVVMDRCISVEHGRLGLRRR